MHQARRCMTRHSTGTGHKAHNRLLLQNHHIIGGDESPNRHSLKGTVSFSLLLVAGAQTARAPTMELSRQPKRILAVDFILASPTPNANGPLPPLQGLRLAAQRPLCPPSGGAGSVVRPALAVQGLRRQGRCAAARRDLPSAAADLPGTGLRPIRTQCQLPGPVPHLGSAGLRGGRGHAVARPPGRACA